MCMYNLDVIRIRREFVLVRIFIGVSRGGMSIRGMRDTTGSRSLRLVQRVRWRLDDWAASITASAAVGARVALHLGRRGWCSARPKDHTSVSNSELLCICIILRRRQAQIGVHQKGGCRCPVEGTDAIAAHHWSQITCQISGKTTDAGIRNWTVATIRRGVAVGRGITWTSRVPWRHFLVDWCSSLASSQVK